jgi:DNA-binding response OmpR family regulator
MLQPNLIKRLPETLPMHILIVDDEPLVAQTLTLVFRRNGFEATTAYDADQAMAAIRSLRPDLVLCDIDMPGRDGIALMRDLSVELPDCPILVLTGFYSSLARIRDYTDTLKQPVSIVIKPCQPTDLLRHADALLKSA